MMVQARNQTCEKQKNIKNIKFMLMDRQFSGKWIFPAFNHILRSEDGTSKFHFTTTLHVLTSNPKETDLFISLF